MNHSSTVASIAKQVNESSLLAKLNLPFILGETNSLSNEGKPGLSNSFGAVSTASLSYYLQMISLFSSKCPHHHLHVSFPRTSSKLSNLVSANPGIRNINANSALPQALWGV